MAILISCSSFGNCLRMYMMYQIVHRTYFLKCNAITKQAKQNLLSNIYDEKQKERLELYALFQDFKAQLMVLVPLLLVLIYVNSVNSKCKPVISSDTYGKV